VINALPIAVWFRHTVHLSDAELHGVLECLSPDERERHSRFRQADDRRDYAAAHALLRTLLSARHGGLPSRWQFVAEPLGKPRVSDSEGHAPSFSLSHCRGLVACAVADGIDLGIDVEAVDRQVDVAEIAERHFSRAEAADVASRSGHDQTIRFIELWTLKEAFAKATGVGLSQPLDTVTFELDDASGIRASGEAIGREDWTFELYEPVPGYRLAVAIRAASVQVEMKVKNAEDSGATLAVLRTSRAGQRR
jgi:4'-phosphopantetheinyl transferase